MFRYNKIVPHIGINKRSTPLKHDNQLTQLSLLMLTLSALLFSTLWMYRTLYHRMLPIHTVKIVGFIPTELKEPLKEVIVPFTSKSLVSFHYKELRDCIKRLSWVETVKIPYQLSGQLTIYIDVRKPVARFDMCGVNNEKKMYLLDHQGFVFEMYTKSQWMYLPRLVGTLTQVKTLIDCYRKAHQILQAYTLKIRMVKLDNHQRLYITLENNIQLILRHFDSLQPLQVLMEKNSGILHQFHKIHSIDLRYPKGIAVQFHQLTT